MTAAPETLHAPVTLPAAGIEPTALLGPLESEIQDAKFRVLLAESALAKARAAVVSAEVDLKCAMLRLEKLSSHE